MVDRSYRNLMNILSIFGIRVHTIDLSVEHTFVVSLSPIDNHSTARRCVKQYVPSYEGSSLGEPSGSELTMTIIDNEMC
jgi:hypothetical protein